MFKKSFNDLRQYIQIFEKNDEDIKNNIKKINTYNVHIIVMAILDTLFTGIAAIAVGIFLGFVIAGILGSIIYGIIKLKERWQNRSN